MAPSQNQDIETLEYTHKKFNCGYSHKKLGMRLIRRNSDEEERMQPFKQEKTTQINRNSSKSTLFRPYDLQNKSSRETTHTSHVQVAVDSQSAAPHLPELHHFMPFYAAQQSQEEYIQKLQRQRAALYIKHVMQFYENGNGWPSVHPNAINNPAFYYSHQKF